MIHTISIYNNNSNQIFSLNFFECFIVLTMFLSYQIQRKYQVSNPSFNYLKVINRKSNKNSN